MRPLTIPARLAGLSVRHGEGRFWKAGKYHAVESITLASMAGAGAVVDSARTRCGLIVGFPSLSGDITPDCKKCGAAR